MRDAFLLSGLECYISSHSTEDAVINRKENARATILREGGIVRSFVDEDVNVILSVGDSFDTIQQPCGVTIPVVSEDWLILSVQSSLLLPFVLLWDCCYR